MRAWMTGAYREVAERDTHRQNPQPHLRRRAERALVVAVDDDQARALGAADVVLGTDRFERGGAEIGQTPANASKIRFAPGSSLIVGAW
jgi:hypothetical protein